MPITTRHKRAAKNMGKSRTEAQALMNAEYSESYARSGQIKHTKGWQELMDQELPDNELLKVHKEGLKATKRAYEGDIEPDYPTRHKYLDSAYKVKGLNAPEKHINVNVEVEASPEIKALADKLNALQRSTDFGSDGIVSGTLGAEAQNQE